MFLFLMPRKGGGGYPPYLTAWIRHWVYVRERNESVNDIISRVYHPVHVIYAYCSELNVKTTRPE